MAPRALNLRKPTTPTKPVVLKLAGRPAPTAIAKKKPAPAQVAIGMGGKISKAQPGVVMKAPKVATKVAPKLELRHAIEAKYDGPSQPFLKGKSKTPIHIDEFGVDKALVLTERTAKALKALYAEFGRKPFQRANTDAMVLNRAIWKGVMQHVAGGADDPAATYKFISDKF